MATATTAMKTEMDHNSNEYNHDNRDEYEARKKATQLNHWPHLQANTLHAGKRLQLVFKVFVVSVVIVVIVCTS